MLGPSDSLGEMGKSVNEIHPIKNMKNILVKDATMKRESSISNG